MSYHFVTGDFEKRSVFLPDKEYGLALDALVKGCADVLVTAGDGRGLRVLLGKRKVEPQPDWWFVGGRTRPGDSPAEGAARNVKRELGLALPPERFVAVNTYSFVWRYRVQAPATNGTADMSTVFELHLTRTEASGLGPEQFDEKEYETAAWVAPLDILAGDYHPALQQAVRDLLANRAYRDLRDVVAAPPAVVARAARHYVAWRDAAPVRHAKVRFDGDGYAFVDIASGAAVPRPVKPAPPLRPPLLLAPRDFVFYAALSGLAFAVGRATAGK
mmetsp:Transcript_23347/g.73089  ORF Transcript_23347/g.73089 Transcript_23347/m.73089 type:complete len:274 (-) Transcript_23347:54-875(-)